MYILNSLATILGYNLRSVFHLTLFDSESDLINLSGFNKSEFEKLEKRFANTLLDTCLSDPTRTKNAAGRYRSLSARSLLWIRQYPVERFLQWIFNIPQKQVYQYNHATLYVMFEYYSPLLQMPDFNTRKQNGIKFYGVLITVVIDGTEQQTYQ